MRIKTATYRIVESSSLEGRLSCAFRENSSLPDVNLKRIGSKDYGPTRTLSYRLSNGGTLNIIRKYQEHQRMMSWSAYFNENMDQSKTISALTAGSPPQEDINDLLQRAWGEHTN